MRRIIAIAALVLSVAACDPTQLPPLPQPPCPPGMHPLDPYAGAGHCVPDNAK